MKIIIIEFYDLPVKVLEQLKLRYPYGFKWNLITHEDEHGNELDVLPFSYQETKYLIQMTAAEAVQIIKNDDDYNILGHLKKEMKKKYKIDDSAFDEDSFEGQIDANYEFDEFV